MESRETIPPTRAPEAPSSYQLALTTTNSNTQTTNPSQMTGPQGFSMDLGKKKRGRPRKYGPDGMAAGGRTLSPMPLPSASSPPPSGRYSDTRLGEGDVSGEFQAKKKKKKKSRMSSSEKSNMSLGSQITSGGSFTPHMVTVNPGEDVTSKIISFSKYGPRAICVISALGIISHVTLRQANSSGGTVTYEGRFEILSLSGSFTPGEVGGISSREGGISIALSSPDGRVVGGLLGGLLTAAGPVQVVVASFVTDVGSPVGKPRKPQDAIKLMAPVADRAAHMETQNLNEQSQESPTNGNTPPPARFQHPMPSVHDWRRAAADMNMPLRED